ncbi:MAG: hypothetical protein ACLSDQ_08180 [Adlercreutzia equolifaciens]
MNDESMVKSICMDADDIERAVTRMAHQILEANKGGTTSRCGHRHARRPSREDARSQDRGDRGGQGSLGKLDISFYRDDFDPYVPESIPPYPV